jgi:5-methylcytosine-specific restriction enzyme subunit McrC
MTIPVQNIYYLLCYAWDSLEYGEMTHVDTDDFDSIESLLAKVLIESTDSLLKRGLVHDYIETEAEIAGVKGRINFDVSMRRQLFRQGKAHCRFDDFTANILPNQIIKSTLSRLMRLNTIGPKQKKELHTRCLRLQAIDTIELKASDFQRVQIHSNNALYGFLMNICELVFHNTGLNEHGQQRSFRDFLRDEKKMSRLFEKFVRNFYSKAQKQYASESKRIDWKFSPDSTGNRELFPQMITDITLTSATEKIIVEIKYYPEALVQSQYGKHRFRSTNLYQLFAYLTNLSLDQSHPGNASCSGILLYPTVDIELDETYQLANHRLRIYTLNLNQPWQGIRADLLSLLPLNN